MNDEFKYIDFRRDVLVDPIRTVGISSRLFASVVQRVSSVAHDLIGNNSQSNEDNTVIQRHIFALLMTNKLMWPLSCCLLMSVCMWNPIRLGSYFL